MVQPRTERDSFQKEDCGITYSHQHLYDLVAYMISFELLLSLLRYAEDYLLTFGLGREKQYGLLDYVIKCRPARNTCQAFFVNVGSVSRETRSLRIL